MENNSIFTNETCAKKKTNADTKIRTTIIDIQKMLVSLSCQLGYGRIWTSEYSVIFQALRGSKAHVLEN